MRRVQQIMNISIKHLAILFAAGLTLAAAEAAICCPFCSTQGQTLTEEMGTMDAVVVAELVQRPPEDKDSEAMTSAGRPSACWKSSRGRNSFPKGRSSRRSTSAMPPWEASSS